MKWRILFIFCIKIILADSIIFFLNDLNNEGVCVCKTSDNGYVLTGSYNVYSSTASDIFFMKLDSSLNIEWTKVLNGTHFDRGNFLAQVLDGNIIVAGLTWSYGVGGDEVYLAKLSPDGEVYFQKAIGTSDDDFAMCVDVSEDGGYIVAGGTEICDSGGYTDGLIIKFSGHDSIEWSIAIGKEGKDRIYSIESVPDGGYIFTGETKGYGADETDIWIGRISSAGELLWSKSIITPGTDKGNFINQIDDSTYILVAHTMGGFGGENSGLIFSITSDGELNWGIEFDGFEDIWIHSCVIDYSDTSIIVAGELYSDSLTEHDIFISKLLSKGYILWTKRVRLSGNEKGNFIIRSDSGYAIVGKSDALGGNNDILFIYTDSNGNTCLTDEIALSGHLIIPPESCLFMYSESVFVTTNNIASDQIYNVEMEDTNICSELKIDTHQNILLDKIPTICLDGFVYLKSPQTIASIEVIDISGRIILFYSNVGKKEYTLQMKETPSGIYFLRIFFYGGKQTIVRILNIQ